MTRPSSRNAARVHVGSAARQLVPPAMTVVETVRNRAAYADTVKEKPLQMDALAAARPEEIVLCLVSDRQRLSGSNRPFEPQPLCSAAIVMSFFPSIKRTAPAGRAQCPIPGIRSRPAGQAAFEQEPDRASRWDLIGKRPFKTALPYKSSSLRLKSTTELPQTR